MVFQKSYLTPKQVAELLMVSVSAIRLWAERGEIKAMVTAGGHRRFKLEDVKQFAKDKNIQLNVEIDKHFKILIVDDEQMFAEYLQEALESSLVDVQVRISLDGFDAGVKLRDFSPNVVLLDLMMPTMNGFQVCKQIKQDPLYRYIRVIAMSGNASQKNKQRIMEAGAEACLAKPIEIQELLLLLHKNSRH